MTSKRKFEKCFSEINCIGHEYLCPHTLRSVRRKIPRKVHFGQILRCDANGFLLYNIGDVIYDRYEILSEIGRGGFGIALKVNDKDRKETVVLKAVKNEEGCHSDAVKEVLTLKLLKRLDPLNEHHIVQLLNAFCSGGLICLILELLGPDLFNFTVSSSISALTLVEIRSIGQQLCDAIRFLHENELVHNDIKPDNIAFVDTTLSSRMYCELERPLSNTDIRVIDLGSVKSINDTRYVAITCAYRAPESLLGLQSTYSYDIWGIGCTLFELYTGRRLFETDQEYYHLAMIEQLRGKLPVHMTKHSKLFKNGKLIFDRRTKVARNMRKNLKDLEEFKCSVDDKEENEFFELLKRMLTLDPEKRITADEALRHEFFDKKSKEVLRV